MNTPNESVKVSSVRLRSQLYQAIRSFFQENDFVEVETPVRVKTPALEEYIDAEPSGNFFLRTSPELHMKRLIQAGLERIFQIGACFRQNENGAKHRPEFAMLEWYVAHANYRDLLIQTQNFIQFIFQEIYSNNFCTYQGNSINFQPPWPEISVAEAFATYGEVDLDTALAQDNFERILVEDVEPKLGISSPTFLMDYPIQFSTLARPKFSNKRLAERWELYIGGLELANACSELTDTGDQRQRFELCARTRHQQNREVYPMDNDFLQALENGMPECAGCALGIDRLLMILTNCKTIDDVLFF